MVLLNLTTGALLGYSSENSSVNLKVPAWQCRTLNRTFQDYNTITQHHARKQRLPPSHGVSSGPNITAFQSIILSLLGDPLTPCGGSLCNLLKSLISLCNEQQSLYLQLQVHIPEGFEAVISTA